MRRKLVIEIDRHGIEAKIERLEPLLHWQSLDFDRRLERALANAEERAGALRTALESIAGEHVRQPSQYARDLLNRIDRRTV